MKEVVGSREGDLELKWRRFEFRNWGIPLGSRNSVVKDRGWPF